LSPAAAYLVTVTATFLLFNLALFLGSGYYLVSHGVDYVAWPRLRPLTDTINYSGKGYFSGRHGRGFAASGGHKVGGKNKRLEVAHSVDLGAKGEKEKDMEIGQAAAAAAPGKKRVD